MTPTELAQLARDETFVSRVRTAAASRLTLPDVAAVIMATANAIRDEWADA